MRAPSRSSVGVVTEIRKILADLRTATALVELCVNLGDNQEGPGAPTLRPYSSILQEALDRLEHIPPRIYDLIHVEHEKEKT